VRVVSVAAVSLVAVGKMLELAAVVDVSVFSSVIVNGGTSLIGGVSRSPVTV
jgi:hypothetical protein